MAGGTPAPANLAAGVVHVLAVHDKAAALGIIPQFATLSPMIRPDSVPFEPPRAPAQRVVAAIFRGRGALFRRGGARRARSRRPLRSALSARLAPPPGAAALAASDEEGRERLRAALEGWPVGLRRRVYARFRRLEGRGSADAVGEAAAGRRPVSRLSARVSGIPVGPVSGTPTRNVANAAPDGRRRRWISSIAAVRPPFGPKNRAIRR
jgi:hypothetical protein